MRLLTVFILSLYFLLSGETAAAFQHGGDHAPAKIFQAIARANFIDPPEEEVSVCRAETPPGVNGADNEIKAVECQENEVPGTSGKDSDAGHSCISFYCTQVGGIIPHGLNNRLPVCDHFSCSSSPKFIIHRVLRI